MEKKSSKRLISLMLLAFALTIGMSGQVSAKQKLDYPKTAMVNLYESFHGIPMTSAFKMEVKNEDGSYARVTKLTIDNKKIATANRMKNNLNTGEKRTEIVISGKKAGKTKGHFWVGGKKYDFTIVVKPYPVLFKKVVLDGEDYSYNFARAKGGRSKNTMTIEIKNYYNKCFTVGETQTSKEAKTSLDMQLVLKEGAKLEGIDYENVQVSAFSKVYACGVSANQVATEKEPEIVNDGPIAPSVWANIQTGAKLPYNDFGCYYIFHVRYKGKLYRYEIEYVRGPVLVY